MTGLSDLTPRQLAVAALVGKSHTTKQISIALQISEQRVRVIISSIAFRIGADAERDEKIQVALWWHQQTGHEEAA